MGRIARRASKRHRVIRLSVLVAASIVWDRPAAEVPATYTVDAARSEIVVLLYRAGPGARWAHDHVVEAKSFTGEIRYDPSRPALASVSVTVEAGSLVPDRPQLVERYGIRNTLDEKQRQKVRETLLGQSQLDVGRFPTIAFRGQGIETGGGGTYVSGTFTLHGVSREIRIPVTIELAGDEVLHASGESALKQTDHGIRPFRAALGTVRVKDEATLKVRLVAVPTPGL